MYSFNQRNNNKYKKNLNSRYNRRFPDTKKKESVVVIDFSNNEAFPSLNNIDENKNSLFNKDNLKYKNIIENEMKNNSLKPQENIDKNTHTTNGWVILNKENLETYKAEYEINKKKIEIQQNKNQIAGYGNNHPYNNMFIRWNNFRDEINNLQGDISPYFNYKKEIEILVEEENDILEQIYGSNSYYSSDDDNDYENEDYYFRF